MAKNIYQKIAAVMEDVKYIQKTGRNSFHKYNYASEADYINSIRPSLLKHGLVVVPTVTKMEQNGELVHVHMNFQLVNIDNPSETVTYSCVGSGSDKGDKAAYKALTGAKKYFLSLSFLIETGDDAEADESVDKRAADSKPSATVSTIAEVASPPTSETKAVSSQPKTKAPAFRPGRPTAAPVAPKTAESGDSW